MGGYVRYQAHVSYLHFAAHTIPLSHLAASLAFYIYGEKGPHQVVPEVHS